MVRFVFIFSLLSNVCFADKLILDVQAKDLFVKGTFPFQPGNALKISGKDSSGKLYELTLVSKVEKEAGVQFICRLVRQDQRQSVSVVTSKGHEGQVTTGPRDGPPDLKFGATWTE